MSSSRAGGGSGSAAIPANARKTVQSLKEIVPNSEDEIYAVLKECNMDPNETVQRLLNQDPFHEVKRKRDKKKEWNKETNDSRPRSASGGTQTRGGRGGLADRGSGRGAPLGRHASNDSNGGRGKSFVARENGNVNSSSRAASTIGSPSSSNATYAGQGKSYLSGLSNHSVPATTPGTSVGVSNGIPAPIRPVPVPQGSWGSPASGHATMADIVKANGAHVPSAGAMPAVSSSMNSVGPPVTTSVTQQYIIPPTISSPPASSGVYSSSTDPVLLPSLDTRTSGTPGAIKREIGTVGNQRVKGEWSSASVTMDSRSISTLASQPLQVTQTSSSSPGAVSSLERDSQVKGPNSPPLCGSPPVLQDRTSPHSAGLETVSSVGMQARPGAGPSSGAPGSRAAPGCGPFSSRPVYLSQQHPVGTQKAAGTGLEWKPKLVVQSSVNMSTVNTPSPSEGLLPSSPSTVPVDTGALSATTSKMQAVSIRGDPPVIIPDHLQVAEADGTHLSFGSFGAGFGTSFAATFASEDSNKPTNSIAESTPVAETTIDQTSASSVVNTVAVPLSQSYGHQSIPAPEEVLTSGNETAVASLPPSTVLQSDILKPDPIVAQGPHYPYLPAIPSYPGFNVVQQVPPAQYTYETTETQSPDVARLPSLVPYSDPAASYYTPGFRPSSDGDARYPPFVTSNTSNKYNGNMGLVNLTGQNLPSQESGNAVLPPVPAAQASQTGNAQTVPSVPQQPLPLHAYTGQPTGAPLGHHFGNVFGYQYIPQSYAYMHAHPPYQHNYTTSGVYPQAPTGSSYPPAAASTYPPGGATSVKYPLPQYKPGSATAIAPHSATPVGYGGYSSAPSGYAANPSVTVGSTTGYDDLGVGQYKDLYIPSQQVEGSTVWIQAPLSRDMTAGGMQTSSYYNLPGQGQHGAYAHTQQSAHSHPGAYAGLYHPSQSGQAPAAHQLLQQPQAGGGGGSQVGGYQQPQRAQQTWTNTY